MKNFPASSEQLQMSAKLVQKDTGILKLLLLPCQFEHLVDLNVQMMIV